MISGQLEWIGLEQEHGIISLDSVLAIKEQGLEGDKITLKKSKKKDRLHIDAKKTYQCYLVCK